MPETFFQNEPELVLCHPMRVSNYFVNSFYSVTPVMHLDLWISLWIFEKNCNEA